MRIGIPAESASRDPLVAATPRTVAQLIALGYEVVAAGAGAGAAYRTTLSSRRGPASGPPRTPGRRMWYCG